MRARHASTGDSGQATIAGSVTHGLVEVCLQRTSLAECLAQHALVDFVQGVRVEAVQRQARAFRTTGRFRGHGIEPAALRAQAQ